MALITALLILIVVALLAVSMTRSVALQDKIAGNTLEKQRSLQAAQSALQYGEWWLGQGNGTTGVACSGVFSANNNTTMKVCPVNTAPTTTSALPWTTRWDYTPPKLTVAAGGGLVSSSSTGVAGDVNYAALPSLYINYVGVNGSKTLYQVTAVGYGGSNTTASVVQSVYALTAKTQDLGGGP